MNQKYVAQREGGGVRCQRCGPTHRFAIFDKLPPPLPSPRRTMQPIFATTAARQFGVISHDGRSATSKIWEQGSAYVRMCPTCGLEPSRPGKSSNCMCLCNLSQGGCGKPLYGQKLCGQCGWGSYSPDPPSIATVHIKAKRARQPPQSSVSVAALPYVEVAVVGASAAVRSYVDFGQFSVCGTW